LECYSIPKQGLLCFFLYLPWPFLGRAEEIYLNLSKSIYSCKKDARNAITAMKINSKWMAKDIQILRSPETEITHEFCRFLKQNFKNQQETWLTSLKSLLPFWIHNIILVKNEIIIYTSVQNLNTVISFFYYHTNTLFQTISDLTAIDYPDLKFRFEVTYLLLSPIYSIRLRIKTLVDEITPIPSITNIYSGANWMERETWDMFGIYFYNHPDLRRILTDYGFEGFPLLKNWPLSGYMEVRYSDIEKRVIYGPIEITQEFRNYDMLSPWIARSEIEE
jgi:NADH/F420H2 dehydrogenase subunit C